MQLIAFSSLFAVGGSVSLGVTWRDCADETYHAKITDVEPKSISVGGVTTITGTGNLDEDVSDQISYEASMQLQFSACTGIASEGSKCEFPLKFGSVNIAPIPSPIKTGSIDIDVDLSISRLLPATLLSTTTNILATGKTSGKQVFCLNVGTKRSPDSHIGVGILDVTWEDCGDSAVATVTNLTPSQFKQGGTNKIVGTGSVSAEIDEDIEFTTTSTLQFVDCVGDDATKDNKCKFPLDFGYIEWKGLETPVSQGPVPVAVDVSISKALPPAQLRTTTHVTAKTAGGENLFCLDIMTAPPAEDEVTV